MLERAEPWWGSLGASLLLHGALVAGVMALWLGKPLAQEAPDFWQGNLVMVDTEGVGALVGNLAADPAAAPAQLPAAPVQPPATDLAGAAEEAAEHNPPSVKHGETLKQSATVKHSATLQHQVKQSIVARTEAKSPPKPKDEEKEARDPNAALLAKVMGYQPNARGSDAPSSADTEQPTGESSSEAPGGSHQQATVRNLPKAFTRALANAAAGDAARYSRLPSGKLEEARATIEVGSGGEVTGHSLNREASSRMKDLVRRTIASLGAGQFALRETQVSAGTLHLQVEVWLSGDSDGNERVTEIGFEAPRPQRDGKAYFLLGSGWRFEAQVRELR